MGAVLWVEVVFVEVGPLVGLWGAIVGIGGKWGCLVSFWNGGYGYISVLFYSVLYNSQFLILFLPPSQISITGHPTAPPVRCLPSVPQGQCHLSVPAPGARRVRQVQGGHRHDAHQHHAEGGAGHHVPGQPDPDGHSADR